MKEKHTKMIEKKKELQNVLEKVFNIIEEGLSDISKIKSDNLKGLYTFLEDHQKEVGTLLETQKNIKSKYVLKGIGSDITRLSKLIGAEREFLQESAYSLLEKKTGKSLLKAIYKNYIPLLKNKTAPIVSNKERDWKEDARRFEQDMLEIKTDKVSVQFTELLTAIKKEAEKRYIRPSCFISYAWPSERNIHEAWVQPFLGNLYRHLKLAGIDVKIDIKNSRYGNNTVHFMNLINEVDYVLLIGTESLLEKHESGVSMVCHELVLSNDRQRQENLKEKLLKTKGKNPIIPLLLSGTFKKALPAGFRTYTAIEDFQGKSYVQGLKELIAHLYGFAQDSIHYAALWEPFEKKHILLYQGLGEKEVKQLKEKEQDTEVHVKKEYDIQFSNFMAQLSQERESYIPEIFKIDPQNKQFTGRTEILSNLKDILEKNNNCSITYAISGMGGIGKTQVAKEYAHQHKYYYQIICWMDADVGLDLGFRTLAERLSISVQNRKKEEIRNAVKEKLRTMPDWLLIFDDATSFTQIREYIPEQHLGGRGHVLVTSRNSINWPSVSLLDVFSIEEAIKYITKVTEQTEGARELSTLLGRLPLALAQASSYIKNTVTIYAYIKLFEERHQDLWAKEQGYREGNNDPSIYDKYMKGEKGIKLTIKTALDLSLDAIKKSSDGQMAISVLERSAYLYHEQIPESLLKESFNQKNIDPLEFNSAIKELAKHSIFTANIQKKKESEGGEENIQTYSLHQLTQQVIRDSIEERKQVKVTKNLLESIDQSFPLVSNDPMKGWNKAVLLKNHAKTISHFVSNKSTKQRADLLKKLSYFERHITLDFNKSLEYSKQVLAIHKKLCTRTSPNIANSHNSIGYAYHELGKLKECLDHYKKALEIYKEYYTDNHPDTANSLNNIGLAYSALGETSQSLFYLKKALNMYRAIDPVDPVVVAFSLSSVGIAYYELGDTAQSLDCFKEALEIRQNLYRCAPHKGSHPDIADSFNNMGIACGKLGKTVQSLNYYTKALAMSQDLYPSNHPFVARFLSNLGCAYRDSGKTREGLPYLVHALEMRKVLFTDNHPDIVDSLHSLGLAYKNLNNMEESLTYLEKASRMSRSIYEENHPDVVSILKSISTIHRRKKLIECMTNPVYATGAAVTIVAIGGFVAYLQAQKENAECRIL